MKNEEGVVKGLPVERSKSLKGGEFLEHQVTSLSLDLGIARGISMIRRGRRRVHVVEVIRHFSEGIWGYWVALGTRHVQIWAVQGHSGYNEANEYYLAIRKNKILPFAVHGWTWRALS